MCRGRLTLPTVSTLWLGSKTLSLPGQPHPYKRWSSGAGQSPEGWFASPPSSSGLSAPFCSWGQALLFLRSRTNNPLNLPSLLPAVSTELCFVIDSELWVKLCSEYNIHVVSCLVPSVLRAHTNSFPVLVKSPFSTQTLVPTKMCMNFVAQSNLYSSAQIWLKLTKGFGRLLGHTDTETHGAWASRFP